MGISQDQIKQQLIKFYNENNYIPTFKDISKHFPFSGDTVDRLFGGFNKALNTCNIPINKEFNRSNKPIKVKCGFCKKYVIRTAYEAKKSKSGFSFCNRSCAASYNNANKKHGTRRSKLEVFIAENLSNDFPELNILFNDINTINAELDIYFPDLRFAIELNGIVHYEPIYGEDKFEKIVNKDKQKMILCYENGIELCVLDVSSYKHFNKKSAFSYYIQVKEIIEPILKRKQ